MVAAKQGLRRALVAGALAFFLAKMNEAHWNSPWVASWTAWQSYPGVLINVVFAAILLGFDLTPRLIWHEAVPQLILAQILGWGQYAVAVGVGMAFHAHDPTHIPPQLGALVAIGLEAGKNRIVDDDPRFRPDAPDDRPNRGAQGGDPYADQNFFVGTADGHPVDQYVLAASSVGNVIALLGSILLLNWRAKLGGGTRASEQHMKALALELQAFQSECF